MPGLMRPLFAGLLAAVAAACGTAPAGALGGRAAMAQGPPSPRAPLTVGPGQRFPTLAAAVAASRDGDLLLVQAGTYRDDVAEIGTRITIRAVGGMARLLVTRPPANGKAILVVNTDVAVEGLEFAGAAVVNLNGAGIRYQGGHLTVRGSRFRGNQMNLLAAGDPAGSITIERSEFGPTLPSEGGLSHGLYVNEVGALTVRDSLFHGAATGHQIKSRALRTTIAGSRIFDGEGHASYSVDLPNGGHAVIEGNVIEQGPNTHNPAIIHFGGEGEVHPGSSLRIAGNAIVNRLASPKARLLHNQAGVGAELADNRVFGLGPGQMASGPATVSRTRTLAAPLPLDRSAPWAGAVRASSAVPAVR